MIDKKDNLCYKAIVKNRKGEEKMEMGLRVKQNIEFNHGYIRLTMIHVQRYQKCKGAYAALQ